MDTLAGQLLWQSQDKRQDAYELQVPVYGWFTEGFDIADLQEASPLSFSDPAVPRAAAPANP